MDEESKAIAEVAKTTGKGIDAIREMGRAISRYFGVTIEEAVGIFNDKLKYYRWERQIRLLCRANDLLAERGLRHPSKSVPLPFAIAVMENASLEEDDWMQDKWAALLANAADASFDTQMRRAFVSILEDLTSLDAKNLEKIYAQTSVHGIETALYTSLLPECVTEKRPDGEHIRPSPEIGISLGNLARLGLITTATTWGGVAMFSCVNGTVLGETFMRAIGLDRQIP